MSDKLQNHITDLIHTQHNDNSHLVASISAQPSKPEPECQATLDVAAARKDGDGGDGDNRLLIPAKLQMPPAYKYSSFFFTGQMPFLPSDNSVKPLQARTNTRQQTTTTEISTLHHSTAHLLRTAITQHGTGVKENMQQPEWHSLEHIPPTASLMSQHPYC